MPGSNLPPACDSRVAAYRLLGLMYDSLATDDRSVYGFVHKLPMPDGHGTLRSLRYETRNSGLFYVAATHEGRRLVDILRRRMANEEVWD